MWGSENDGKNSCVVYSILNIMIFICFTECQTNQLDLRVLCHINSSLTLVCVNFCQWLRRFLSRTEWINCFLSCFLRQDAILNRILIKTYLSGPQHIRSSQENQSNYPEHWWMQKNDAFTDQIFWNFVSGFSYKENGFMFCKVLKFCRKLKVVIFF